LPQGRIRQVQCSTYGRYSGARICSRYYLPNDLEVFFGCHRFRNRRSTIRFQPSLIHQFCSRLLLLPHCTFPSPEGTSDSRKAGRIIRWRKRRFVVVDCTGFEAIIAPELGVIRKGVDGVNSFSSSELTSFLRSSARDAEPGGPPHPLSQGEKDGNEGGESRRRLSGLHGAGSRVVLRWPQAPSSRLLRLEADASDQELDFGDVKGSSM